MILVLVGLLLLMGVCSAIIAVAFKAQQSVKSSKHQSMLSYGIQTQLLQDTHDLHRFGIAQQLRRRLGGLSAFGLSFNTMAFIGSAAFLFGPAILEGGASVIGFGLPVIALFALAVSTSLAELASAVPTAGGSYHVASALGGRRWGWKAGIFQAAGHIAMLALLNCACSAILNQFLSNKFGYQASDLIFWCIVFALTIVQGVINHWGRSILDRLQAAAIWLQVFIAIILLIGFVWIFWPGIYSPVVLYQFQNSQLSGTVKVGVFISGSMLLLKMFVGMDGASHGAEETIDPRIRIPWAIYLSTAYTFLFSFVLFVFMVLNTAVLERAGYVGLFLQTAISGLGGTSVIVLVVLISLWCSGLHTLTVCSRILFSLARDGALPMNKRWSAVSERLQVPIQAVWLSAVGSLIGLAIAFFSNRTDMSLILLSFAIITLQLSYAIPIALKLKKGENNVIWHYAPWRVGSWSVPINWISLIWLAASVGLASIYIHYWGAGFAFMLMLVIFVLEFKNRKRDLLRMQTVVIRSRKELYHVERRFPLNK